MEVIQKQVYEEPSTKVIEAKYGGVLCASGNTERFGSGNSYGDSDFD